MIVERIISGGQVGADIAGLRAGKQLGLETGGWAPKGWRTIDGQNRELKTVYGLDENDSYEYAERTIKNVADSDGTVRFAYNFSSWGELATAKAIRKHNKPSFDVQIKMELDNSAVLAFPKTLGFLAWVRNNDIKVLNVAGNANVVIEEFVERFLVDALKT